MTYRSRILLFAITVTVSLSFTGCGRSVISVAGAWGRQIESHDVRLRFNNDGSFQLQVGDRARTVEGQYEIQDDIIVLTDEDCGELEGRYKIGRDENTLIFSEINDTCEGRARVLEGTWSLEK